MASHQLDVELAPLVRVVVTVDFEVLFVYALEFLPVKVNYRCALFINRHEHSARTVFFNAEFLTRAGIIRKTFSRHNVTAIRLWAPTEMIEYDLADCGV